MARHWGRGPKWFYTLDAQTRVNVLAEYRLHNSTPEQIQTRQNEIKRVQLNRMIERQRGYDGPNNKTR